MTIEPLRNVANGVCKQYCLQTQNDALSVDTDEGSLTSKMSFSRTPVPLEPCLEDPAWHARVNMQTFRLRANETEAEFRQALLRLLREFGLEHYFLMAIESTERGLDFESLRYVLDGQGRWRERYTEKGFHYIDPYLQHALSSRDPLLLSDAKATTTGQAQLIEEAALYGIRSGLVSTSVVFGNTTLVLYLTSSRRPEYIDDFLHLTKPLLRTIGNEVFEWWAARERQLAIERLSLSENDLQLLRFVLKDLHSEDMAQLMGMTTSQVNNRFRWINKEFGVSSRRESARRAVVLGLI